jgi:flagellar hook protein FlgE
MSLTSSLFSGVSGLAALGNSMTVIGDNIANVNTVGFKSSQVLFQDVLSQTVATQSGSAQVGRGTSLGDVTAQFDQGSFESTSSPTDLAIGGEGFFVVRDPNNSESEYYTRAGSFRFDKDGNFVNPAGYIVKGWALARNTTTGDVEDVGSVADIKLANFTSPPEATDSIEVIANLNAQGGNKTVGPDALSQAWNGDLALTSHIGDAAYEYQSTIKVYDSLGSTHDITIYFDRGELDNQYEYIVTCDPNEDKRGIFNASTDAGRGLLGKGTLQFTSSGILGNDAMTFYQFVGGSGGLASANTSWPTAAPTATGAYSGAAALPATYTFTSATTGVIGTDAITVNVSGAGSGSFTIPANYVAGNYVEGPDGMRFQFTPGAASGSVASGNAFNVTVTAGDPNSLSDTNSWADMSGSFTNQHFTFSPDFLGGANTAMAVELNFGTAYNGANWVPDSLSTTQFSSASTTVYQTASGYGAGDLQSISVAVDGAITGNYSNGQVTPLFRVALAKFQNDQGLFKVGGSLFSATRTSGDRITGKPGANGLGSISPNSLEQSNVDISNEFVKMITAQRGFQANSKIVTTVDQMLSDVIAMKR